MEHIPQLRSAEKPPPKDETNGELLAKAVESAQQEYEAKSKEDLRALISKISESFENGGDGHPKDSPSMEALAAKYAVEVPEEPKLSRTAAVMSMLEAERAG